MSRAGKITAYSLAWGAVLLLFAAAVWWVTKLAPGRPLSPEEIAGGARPSDRAPAASIDESLGATDIYIKGAQWTETGKNGKVTMRVRAEEATKLRGQYSIREGSLRFTLKDQAT